MTSKPSKTFEQKMSDIEKIVSSLEHKEMPLDKSLELFEQGASLIRDCQKALQSAEQKISIINNNEQTPHENNN